MVLSLASILAESAARYPSSPALGVGPAEIPYAELWEQARRYGAALKALGIEPDDRVAIMIPNVPDFPRAYYGILAAGAVVVPIHALLTPEEVAYVLRDSGSKLLLCADPLLASGAPGAATAGVTCYSLMAQASDARPRFEDVAARVEPLAAYRSRQPLDDAVILYTSGTTGKPKGAILTQNNLVLNATIGASELCRSGPDDVYLAALPLFHAFGQTVVMNGGFRAGSKIQLMPRFDGQAALDTMLTYAVTVFAGVPTMYIGLLEAAKSEPRRPALRHAMSGGSSMPLAVLEAFEREFAVPIYEGYGLSETSPVASFNQAYYGRKPGTVGRGIWGVDLAIANPDLEECIELLPDGELGEIVIRGHAVFKGYLNNPEATRAAIVDGWFRSGDLGTRDADGFISIVDRKKDMILRGGYNVYPREVEEVLMRHPRVRQVAAIGVPHDVHGEEVVAVVVLDSPEEPFDPDELIAWSQEHLAKYKYPRRIESIDAMPLGPSGKVLKRELRERFRSAR
jgi:long-chain acyl-CoA synthetase